MEFEEFKKVQSLQESTAEVVSPFNGPTMHRP